MRIGINASFLRKPGTGIGQVSTHFLREIVKLQNTNSKYQNAEYVLYCEENPDLHFSLPSNFTVKSFLSFWKRDDLIRKWLWEKQLAQEAKKDGCDAFLSLYQSSTVFRSQAIRHVMVVHDLIPRLFPKYQGNWRKRWYWKATERGIRRADHILAVSEATKNDLVEFGIGNTIITVTSPDVAPLFRNTLALEEENRVMAKYSLVPGYLYHGGGLEIRKNTGGLLQAYALLVEQEKKGMLGTALPPLVISGKIFSEENPLATPVKRLVQELGLGERVRLLDFVPVEDLPALYKNALFFVYPSFYEGFGLPVLEALSLGTPVLTSDNSSLPEVAGDAALYIDPHMIESIASGIERLLNDAALREKLSVAAKDSVGRFSWEHFTKVTLETLSKIS
ncbi:MAG: glycosyltransferase family 1 protein [Candidatus Moraniibacteriota bacterium]